MSVSITKTGLISAALICAIVLATDSVQARERKWDVYENSNFVVYSDESRQVVRKLLKELESFRGAVLQVVDIEVPDSAPKPRVVIFETTSEYLDYVDRDRVGGLPVVVDGIPHIALSSGDNADRSEDDLRHRCAHLMLDYKGIDYPKWFEEGFAWLLTGLEFRRGYKEFTLGKPLRLAPRSDFPMPWKHLISDDFDPHSAESGHPWIQTVYPTWLLAHYFLLGNDGQNALDLARYMMQLSEGRSSLEAFEAVVGEPADDFGQKMLKSYGRNRAGYAVYPLDASTLDLDFQRSEASQDEIRQVLDNLRRRPKQAD